MNCNPSQPEAWLSIRARASSQSWLSSWPSVRPGTPCPGPPDKHRTPGLWRWAAHLGFYRCRRSSPSQEASSPSGTPSGSLWRRTPPGRTEGLGVKTEQITKTLVGPRLCGTEPSALCSHRPGCTLRGGWWCFCVFQSFSSSPSLTPGRTDLCLWHHLVRTEREERKTCQTLEARNRGDRYDKTEIKQRRYQIKQR